MFYAVCSIKTVFSIISSLSSWSMVADFARSAGGFRTERENIPRAKVTLASDPCVDLHTDRNVPVSNGTTCRNRSTPQSGKQNWCRRWCVFFSASQKRSAKGKISARSEFPGLFKRACQWRQCDRQKPEKILSLSCERNISAVNAEGWRLESPFACLLKFPLIYDLMVFPIEIGIHPHVFLE